MALSLRVGPVSYEKDKRPGAGHLCSVIQASAQNPKLVTVASVREIMAGTMLSEDSARNHTASSKEHNRMFVGFDPTPGKGHVFNASTDAVAAKWADKDAQYIRKGWVDIAKLELAQYEKLLDSNSLDAAIACSKVYETIYDLHCHVMAQPLNVFTPGITMGNELAYQRLRQVRQAANDSVPPLSDHAAVYAAYKAAGPDIVGLAEARARLDAYIAAQGIAESARTPDQQATVERANAYLNKTTEQFGDEICMNQTRLLRAWTASALAILDNNVASNADPRRAKEKADNLYRRILQGIASVHTTAGGVTQSPAIGPYNPTVQKYIGYNHAKNEPILTPVLHKAAEMRRISKRVLSANSIGVAANPVEEHVQTSHMFLLRGVGTSVAPPLPVGASGQSVWVSHSLQPLYETPISQGSNLDALAASLCTPAALRELIDVVIAGADLTAKINTAITLHDSGFRAPTDAVVLAGAATTVGAARTATRAMLKKTDPGDAFAAQRASGDAVVAAYDALCAQRAALASHADGARVTLTSQSNAARDAGFHAANFTLQSNGYATLTSGAEALTEQVTRSIYVAVCGSTANAQVELPLPESFVMAIRRYMTVTSWKRHAIGIACSSDMPPPVTAGFWIKALRATNATDVTATAAEAANWRTGKSIPPPIGGTLTFKGETNGSFTCVKMM